MTMEDKRLELQFLLEKVLGSRNVYFQPPSENKLSYPCIVYKLDYINTKYAANKPYTHAERYMLTYVSKRPETSVVEKLRSLPFSAFNRFFTTDSLNHYVFRVYY